LANFPVAYCGLKIITSLALATLNRWVIRYASTIAAKAQSQKRNTNRSWRMVFGKVCAFKADHDFILCTLGNKSRRATARLMIDFGTPVTKIDSPRGESIVPQFVRSVSAIELLRQWLAHNG
jgi:hypothetical protein